MSITAEHSLGFLYLTEDDVQVYVTYDINGLRGLIAEEEPAHVILHVDPTGDKHMLVISPQLAHFKSPQEKFKLGWALLARYGREQRSNNPVLGQINAAYLVASFFDEINS